MAFTPGRMSGNPLLQGFNMGSSIKQEQKELKHKENVLEENARQFDSTHALNQEIQNLNERKQNWTESEDNPYNKSQSLLNESTVKTNLFNKLSKSATSHLDQNFFTDFGTGENAILAEDLLIDTDNDGIPDSVNNNFLAEGYGMGKTSGAALDSTVEALMKDSRYKDIPEDELRGYLSDNWDSMYGPQLGASGEEFNKYINEAYLSAINTDKDGDGQPDMSPEQIEELNKKIGMNPEMFKLLSPSLQLYGQDSDKMAYTMGGTTIPLQGSEEGYKKAQTLLQGGSWTMEYEEDGITPKGYKWVPTKLNMEKESKNNAALNSKSLTANTYNQVKTLIGQGNDANNVKYFSQLAINDAGSDTFSATRKPIQITNNGKSVRHVVDGIVNNIDTEYPIRWDNNNKPYFIFPKQDSKVGSWHGAKNARVYLDDSWATNFGSFGEYLNDRWEVAYPGAH